MNQQEFEVAIRAALNIPAPKNFTKGGQADPYPYRLGSRERIRITQDTVDLIKILHGQGMSKSEIGRQMWIDNSAVGRIIKGDRWAR